MKLSVKLIREGLMDHHEYDKAWYGLVEEIVDLDDQLNQEQASGDEDALLAILFLQKQLASKRHLLKRLDKEGLVQ